MASIEKLNRFVMNPTNLDIQRSRFPRPHQNKTTMVAGKMVPIYLDEVLPGDTFDVSTAAVIRSVTPAVPVMDNAFFDEYFFFVPFRLCTNDPKDWPKICGENFDGFWANQTEETLDSTGNMITLDGDIVEPQSLINYLGIPSGSYSGSYNTLKISQLPIRACLAIWNDWFRDENTQAPISPNLYIEDDADYAKADKLPDVNKFHDYFCSALQSPQKGDAVILPLVGMAPVRTGENVPNVNNDKGLSIYDAHTGSTFVGNLAVNAGPVVSTSGAVTPVHTQVVPGNLWADLGQTSATTINEIRQAFAIQRMLEKDSRGGSRYIELLKSYYGVTIDDATLQRPQYLGGKRIPLNIDQVLQTSGDFETLKGSPLGSTGAFSNTSFRDNGFIKSFNEYGYIIGIGCIRNSQSYSQGIPKLFTRNRRFDFYWPVFANLGEQPIMERELYVDPEGTPSDKVFGYQEAWADYRFHPNIITGYLAPNANDTVLTAWTYTNKFIAPPALNSDFMKQPRSQIDDTLISTESNYQYICDFYFDVTTTRPMPLYSIPGLVDHH